MTENPNNLNQPIIIKTEIENDLSNQQIIPPKIKKINFKIVSIVLVIIILVSTISVGAYYLGTKKTSSSESIQNTTSFKTTPTETIIETPLFTGKVEKLNQDLNLFKDNSDSSSKATYFSAGIFNKGELKGYTRIVASKFSTPGSPFIFILATKDFQNFILNDPNQLTTKLPEENYENPYNSLLKSKIISTKTFDTQHPQEINLDQNFSLFYQDLVSEFNLTNEKDSLGNQKSEYLLVTDFSSLKQISSPREDLTFYFKPNSKSEYFDQMSQSQKDKELLKEKYIISSTDIIVVDSTGLSATYLLTTTKNLNNYQQNLDKKGISPGINFENSSIQSKNNLNFFKTYSTAIPGGCSLSKNTLVTNLNDGDLEQIGLVFNLPVYTIKDKNNSLYRLAFDNKMEYYDSDPNSWDDLNKGIKQPTLSEYINSNPLLFIKDYWQRWIAVGEYDIQLPGGCGKPVIYLYPQKSTEVSVKFNIPVQFTTDIPKYNDSWYVLAKPDGSLQNLKSNQASCQQIDFTKRGSEYAEKSCETNNYPYLYWAGNVYSKDYPKIDKGWIIAKNNLNSFLQNKLSEIGLNSNEKKDFMEYWLPDMVAKSSPYYRISFLQTNELNSLFPMTVEPKPNTVFRIFLDYLPLSEKPKNEIIPQSLNKLIRHGFTLVEWGGLKRY